MIGERVRLLPHSRANSFFSMAAELSLLLRALEAGWVTDSSRSWLLYQTSVPLNVPPSAARCQPAGYRSTSGDHRVGGGVRSRPEKQCDSCQGFDGSSRTGEAIGDVDDWLRHTMAATRDHSDCDAGSRNSVFC